MLQYVSLAEILDEAWNRPKESDQDYMGNSEAAKNYLNDPKMQSMKKLKNSIQKNKMSETMEVVNDQSLALMTDSLFKAHKDDLLRSS